MYMRKFGVLFIMALLPFLVLAQDDSKTSVFGEFGFANLSTFDSYKEYIGKTVIYLPCSPLSYIEKNVFKTEKFVPGREYVITNTRKDLSYKKLVISFQEKDGDKKLKIMTDIDDSYQLPFLFIDDFNTEKTKLIGKMYSDPLVKGEYTITDVKLEDTGGERFKEIIYYVSNPTINKSYKTTDYNATIEKVLNEDKAGSYRSTLIKVEKPENSSERYGGVKTIDDKGITKYSFEDEFIGIIIFGSDTQFLFKLNNKSQNSIKIVWDDAVFIDSDGTTSKVIHSGVKYNEREAPQVATTLIGGASLEDTACPISNIRYDEASKEWVKDSMYPQTILQGVKQFRLMLPIQIKEVINEYIFIFNVKYIYDHPERLNLPN